MTVELIDEIYRDYVGDNGEALDSDRLGNGIHGNSIKKEIMSIIPMNNNLVRRNSQYIHPRHKTSCSKFGPINALGTMMQYNFTWDDIDVIEKLSLANGRKGVGNGRARGSGVSTVREWWNSLFPTKKITTWDIEIIDSKNNITDEFRLYMDKGGVAVISIMVGNDFIKDIRADLRIDSMGPFDDEYKHVSCVRKVGDEYEFIDSAFPREGGLYKCSEKNMLNMIKNRNMRSTAHIFIPSIVVPMIAKDVPVNHQFAEYIKWIVDNGLTTQGGAGKEFKPEAPVTRGELAVFLKRLNDFIENK